MNKVQNILHLLLQKCAVMTILLEVLSLKIKASQNLVRPMQTENYIRYKEKKQKQNLKFPCERRQLIDSNIYRKSH